MNAFRKNWVVIETASYTEPVRVTTRIVEQGLSRRHALRVAHEWQVASNRNKAMVRALVPAAKRKPLPFVTYAAALDEQG